MGTIVEKSEYLTETKDKIKESINNIGGDITNETTFREYAQELQDIYNNIPKTTDTGTNLSLNTLKGKMNIIPKGNIEQETREGYNLFQAKLQTTTDNGITVTNNNDGTFTINGTNTSTSLTTFRLDQSTQNGVDNLQNYEDGTYTLDLGIQNENIQITLMQVNTWQQFIATGMNVRLKSGTITGATGMFIYIAIKGNATLNNVVIKPMFVKGSYTTSTIPSFEQYGQMPSPSYPSDIEVVTGTQEVKVENKNLLPINDTIIGKAWNGASATNRAVVFMKAKPNTKYTISYNSISGFDALHYGERVTIDESVAPITQITTSPTTRTTKSTSNWIFFQFNKADVTLADVQAIKLQVEEGESATSFVEHAEQTQTISLGNIELCKIPNTNYEDKLYHAINGNPIYDSLTSEQKALLNYGSWYKKEVIPLYTFTGNESWTKGSNTYQFYMTKPSDMLGQSQLICNYYKNQETASQNGIWAGNSILYINDLRYTNVDNFKTWLSTTKPKLYYVASTPQDIEITNTTLIEQLNNLEKAQSYNGTTNISSSGNLAMVLSVSALKGE